MLEPGADEIDVHRVHPGAEHDAVGVAHIHAGDVVGPSADDHGIVHHRLFRDGKFQRRGVQRGVAHVHAGRCDLTAGGVEFHGLGALAGLDGQLLFFHDVIVVEVLAHAPQGVACHHALAAVGVEHPHLRVGFLRALHEHDAVGADAVMAVAEGDAQGLGAGDLPVPVLQEDVVVAAGLHLGEFQLLALRPQVADVDELRVVLVVPGGQNVRQCVGGVQ